MKTNVEEKQERGYGQKNENEKWNTSERQFQNEIMLVNKIEIHFYLQNM